MNNKKLALFNTKKICDDISNILKDLLKDSGYQFSFDDEKLTIDEVFNDDGFLPIFIFNNLYNITRFTSEYLSKSSKLYFDFNQEDMTILDLRVNGEFSSNLSKDYFYLLKFIVTLILKNPIFKSSDISLTDYYTQFQHSFNQAQRSI